MKTRLKLSVILLLALSLLFFALVFVAELTDIAVYEHPATVVALSLLGLLTLVCCFSKRWLKLRQIGFLVCHLAVVLFLIAAFAWFVAGERGNMVLYEQGSGQRTAYDVSSDGEIKSSVDLPFTIAVTDFEIEYHPYVYTYSVMENGEYSEKGEVDLTADGFNCGKYGKVPNSEIYDEDGNAKTQIQYGNLLLTWDRQMPAVKQYKADIVYSDGKTDKISVNHPAVHEGWKIYLLSYSYEATETGMNWIVTLQVKRDPANAFAIAGLILCPIGCFLMCLRPRRGLRIIEEAVEDG